MIKKIKNGVSAPSIYIALLTDSDLWVTPNISQQVEYGNVLSVKPAVIEGDREGIVGNLGGAILGGIAGSSIGDGRGQSAATVAGAMVGGIVGQATEEKLIRKQGQEIQIQMDSGKVLSVVQEVKDQAFFNLGDRVRLLTVNGVTRVSY